MMRVHARDVDSERNRLRLSCTECKQVTRMRHGVARRCMTPSGEINSAGADVAELTFQHRWVSRSAARVSRRPSDYTVRSGGRRPPSPDGHRRNFFAQGGPPPGGPPGGVRDPPPGGVRDPPQGGIFCPPGRKNFGI